MSLRKQKRVYVRLEQPVKGDKPKRGAFTIYDLDLEDVAKKIKEAFEQ